MRRSRTRTRRALRCVVAALVVAGLVTIGAAPAAAQLPGLPGDPDDLLEMLEGLDPGELADLLEQLGLPEDTPLDQVLEALQDVAGDDDGLPDGAPGADGDIPGTGGGGFAGYATAEGATVFVALPDELADGLAPALEALGVDGTIDTDDGPLRGLRVDLAQVQADLERAAAGEEVTSRASALLTNLILGSDAADQPGVCAGAPAEVALPPDAQTPLLTLTVLGVDCEETDERAFADAQVAGLDIRLGALLELGLPEEVADGVADAIDALNESLLTPASDGLCDALDPILGEILPGADACADDQPLLQLRNPFDLDVPVVDLDAVGASAEVVHGGDTVTATATSTFTGLNVLGVACAGGDEPPLTFTSTATSDADTATRDASAPPLAIGLCQSEQSALRLLLGDGPLGDIAVFEQIVQDELLDGQLQQVFDGVDQALTQLTTEAVTQGSAVLGDVVGAGTTARTDPFVVASSVPLSGLPGLAETPLGDIGVIVVGGATEVGVNAAPAVAAATPVSSPSTTPQPDQQLPRTGAGAGALLGLAALAGAAALRRRDA